jgi:hypothetical protein
MTQIESAEESRLHSEQLSKQLKAIRSTDLPICLSLSLTLSISLSLSPPPSPSLPPSLSVSHALFPSLCTCCRLASSSKQYEDYRLSQLNSAIQRSALLSESIDRSYETTQRDFEKKYNEIREKYDVRPSPSCSLLLPLPLAPSSSVPSGFSHLPTGDVGTRK